MTPKLKRLFFAAVTLVAANVLYAGVSDAQHSTPNSISPCGGGCYTSQTCTNSCSCFPQIGQDTPGACGS